MAWKDCGRDGIDLLQHGVEPSSSRGGARLDGKFFLSLSKKIGRNWNHLAICLGFIDAEVEIFIADNMNNSQEQCRQMLVAWRRKRTDEEEARRELKRALVDIDRQDLALEILGECGPRKKTRSGNPAQDAADECEQALKIRYMATGSFVPIIPWVPDNMKHILDIYTKLELDNDEDDVEGKVDVYDDIFNVKTREGHPVKLAICTGLPGVGKSTLIDKIAYDWAEGESKTLQGYKLVFVLKMYKLEQHSDLINAVFDQLLAEDTVINRSDLKSYIDNNQDKVLILLDGFDEFITTDLDDSKFGSILKILNRKIGRGLRVLITTRPSHYGILVSKSLIEKPFCHVKVLGFSEEDIEQYVNKFFSGEANKVNGLLERIESSEVLSDLATSPMLLLLMCLLWREDSTLPDTMSRLYDKSVKYIFRRKEVTGISDIVAAIGKIALDGLLPSKQRLSFWKRVFKGFTGLLFEQERIEFTPEQRLSFQEGEFNKSVLDAALRAGILTSQRVVKGLDIDNNVHFAHKTFQEFCAAKYCQNLVKTNAGKFQKILNEITNPEHVEYFLRFCCGDNKPCINAILKMLQKKRQKDKQIWLKITLLCYFERQTEKLPLVDVINSVLSQRLHIEDFISDHLTSLSYFLKIVANQSGGKVNKYLARVRCVKIVQTDFWRCGDLLLQFKQMPNLQTLELCWCSLTGLSFDVSNKLGYQQTWSFFQELQQLRELILHHCELTGEDVEHIAETLSQLPNLVELYLCFNTFSAGSFSHLKEMKYLQKLTLVFCKLTGEDLKHIAESMTNLVQVDLSFNETLGGSFSHMKEMKYLQKLNLQDCGLTGEDLKHIAESLSKMPNLVQLFLSGNKALGGSFSYLKEMEHLEKVSLQNCELTGEDMKDIAESLSKMPNLVQLDLSRNWTLGSLDILSHVKEMKYLKKLHLGKCSLTEAVKAQLATLQIEVTYNPGYYRFLTEHLLVENDM